MGVKGVSMDFWDPREAFQLWIEEGMGLTEWNRNITKKYFGFEAVTSEQTKIKLQELLDQPPPPNGFFNDEAMKKQLGAFVSLGRTAQKKDVEDLAKTNPTKSDLDTLEKLVTSQLTGLTSQLLGITGKLGLMNAKMQTITSAISTATTTADAAIKLGKGASKLFKAKPDAAKDITTLVKNEKQDFQIKNMKATKDKIFEAKDKLTSVKADIQNKITEANKTLTSVKALKERLPIG